MSRTVLCRKYQQPLPGLLRPPFPGPKGQEIFETVSQKAWDEWQKQQTMIINERKLNMIDPKDRSFIQEQMEKFFAGEAYSQAEGYIPEQGGKPGQN